MTASALSADPPSATCRVMHPGEGGGFVVVGEREGSEALAAARPAMRADAGRRRPILRAPGGGRGVIKAGSGEVSVHSAR